MAADVLNRRAVRADARDVWGSVRGRRAGLHDERAAVVRGGAAGQLFTHCQTVLGPPPEQLPTSGPGPPQPREPQYHWFHP